MAEGSRGTGGRGVSRSSARNGNSSRSSKSNSSKGKIGGGKAVQYSVKSSRGKTTYVGSTNNPRARAAQHKESGKMGSGDKLVVETRAVSRPDAQKVEAAKIKAHRQQHGKNPTHNKTKDGQYHLPL